MKANEGLSDMTGETHKLPASLWILIEQVRGERPVTPTLNNLNGEVMAAAVIHIREEPSGPAAATKVDRNMEWFWSLMQVSDVFPHLFVDNQCSEAIYRHATPEFLNDTS